MECRHLLCIALVCVAGTVAFVAPEDHGHAEEATGGAAGREQGAVVGQEQGAVASATPGL